MVGMLFSTGLGRTVVGIVSDSDVDSDEDIDEISWESEVVVDMLYSSKEATRVVVVGVMLMATLLGPGENALHTQKLFSVRHWLSVVL